MAPIWFDSDNFWREKGARILGTAGGSIAAKADFYRASVVIPWRQTSYLYCGAGACYGEMTPPDDPAHFGPEPPMVRICAGKYDSSLPDGRSTILGRFGLDPWDVVATDTGTVGLQVDAVDDPYGDGYPDPQTGYPADPNLEWLAVEIAFRKNTWYPSGRPVFIGEWYVELYEYDESFTAPDPGNGDEDPHADIVCPPRPPWPYRDPIRMVSAPNSAQIRRSRP